MVHVSGSFPASSRISILIRGRFKTGYFKNFEFTTEEWLASKTRATGRHGNEMALFESIFEEAAPGIVAHPSTTTGEYSEHTSRNCNGFSASQ
jgi:hypothetical protein